MIEIIDSLLKLKGQDLYISCQPEVPDFTKKNPYITLNLHSKTHEITLTIPENEKELIEFSSILRAFLEEQNVLLMGWNLKPIFTYFLVKTGKSLFLGDKLFDLRVVERFCAVDDKRPQNFVQAASRFMKHYSSSFKTLHKDVYFPLITEILPKIEACPLIDKTLKQKVYSYYEIEGQVNGRLSTYGAYTQSYVPHTLTPTSRSNLIPPFYDQVFVNLDFKHMEVSVLQWLSNDPILKEILDSGNDLYEVIWTKLTGLQCSERCRKICKSIFLPVIFGKGYKAIAKDLGLIEAKAQKIVDNLYRIFSVAVNWVRSHGLIDGYGYDYYGRRRKIDDDYLVRNFVIQAPASIVCLHKLVQLVRKLDNRGKVIFCVHDGYCIMTHKTAAAGVVKIAENVLQEEHSLYDGLKLKVKSFISPNLQETDEQH